MPKRAFVTIPVTIACGILFGTLLGYLSVPLPYFVGSFLFFALMERSGRGFAMPVPLYRVAIPVLGVMLGARMSAEGLMLLAAAWPLVLLLLAFMATATVAGMVVFKVVGGKDRRTSLLLASPGGFGEVTALADAFKLDMRSIAMVHTLRIGFVVLVVPPVLGWWFAIDLDRALLATASAPWLPSAETVVVILTVAVLGRVFFLRLGLPAAALLGPMTLAGAASVAGLIELRVPIWIMWLTQISLGAYLGSRFGRIRLVSMGRLAFVGVLWAVTLPILAGGFALVGAGFYAGDLTTLYLAFAPGGLPEMALIALILGADGSLVGAFHLLRVSLLSWAVALLLQHLPAGVAEDPEP